MPQPSLVMFPVSKRLHILVKTHRSPMLDAVLVLSLVAMHMDLCHSMGADKISKEYVAGVGQMLQDAGLLKYLPGIISAATRRAELQLQDTEWLEFSFSPDHPMYTATDWDLADPSSMPNLHMVQVSKLLFGLPLLWPAMPYQDSVLPALESVTLRFFLQAMRYTSTMLDMFPEGMQNPPGGLMLLARNTSWAAANMIDWEGQECSCDTLCTSSSARSARQQFLLQSPHSLQATCMLMLVASHATLLQLPDAPDSQAQDDQQHPRPAWQYACRNQDSLPKSHADMLRLLGCSSKAMLWAAALLHTHLGAWGADTVRRVSRAFEGMTAAAQEQLYPGIAPEGPENKAGARQQQQQTKPASTELQELCILAPAVLWHWASLRPCTADEPYGDYMKAVSTACVLGGCQPDSHRCSAAPASSRQ